ncbi:MAG: helix-turn-helix transcriptional regulator [Acetobacteraceae bacterium]
MLSRREYEELVDARDHVMALRDVASGSMPTLTDDELDAYLAAPTPLAFWRKRRGLTQTALSSAAAISQPYLAQMESGRRTGDVAIHARLARILGLRIEDLIPD